VFDRGELRFACGRARGERSGPPTPIRQD